MYNDFVYDPRQFEKNNVLYHYPIKLLAPTNQYHIYAFQMQKAKYYAASGGVSALR